MALRWPLRNATVHQFKIGLSQVLDIRPRSQHNQSCIIVFEIGWDKLYRSKCTFPGLSHFSSFGGPLSSPQRTNWQLKSYKYETLDRTSGSSGLCKKCSRMDGRLYKTDCSSRLDQEVTVRIVTYLLSLNTHEYEAFYTLHLWTSSWYPFAIAIEKLTSLINSLFFYFVLSHIIYSYNGTKSPQKDPQKGCLYSYFILRDKFHSMCPECHI